MKLPSRWIFAAALASSLATAQQPDTPSQPAGSPAPLSAPIILNVGGNKAEPGNTAEQPATQAPKAQAASEPVVPAANAGITALPTLTSEGYWIESAPINEVFQYLARSAGLQFFFNNDLASPEYTVTGHLKLDNPFKQMEDLAVGYGLTVYQQGSIIYLMNNTQLSKLPLEVMCYQLKYLRGAHPASLGGDSASSGGSGSGGTADFEKLKGIIKPMLTPELGQIEFEEKTNVLLVTDNSVKLQKVRQLLEQIDRPKQQIIVNVRILRVRNQHGSKVGVDWRGLLGDGMPINATQSLNALFNLPNASLLTKTLDVTKTIGRDLTVTTVGGTGLPTTSTFNQIDTNVSSNATGQHGTSTYTDGAGLVFSALQMEAIVHALNEKNIVNQEACPTIITEDNEQGIISVVDRYPVITSDISNTQGGISTITDKVRYKIDEEDPNASDEPEKSREIGVTLSVTPTLLPDGTVRMRLRPRVANIVELIPGKSGNLFPRVSESTIEGISRIPQGQSLFLGGFYQGSDGYNNSKVPVLGSLPLLSKMFTYREKDNQQISLVFIITPKIYDAGSANDIPSINQAVRLTSGFNRNDEVLYPTPLLPEPNWQNRQMPDAADRDPEDPQPTTPEQEAHSRKRSWLGRLFVKDGPPPAEGSKPAQKPAAPESSASKRRASSPLSR